MHKLEEKSNMYVRAPVAERVAELERVALAVVARADVLVRLVYMPDPVLQVGVALVGRHEVAAHLAPERRLARLLRDEHLDERARARLDLVFHRDLVARIALKTRKYKQKCYVQPKLQRCRFAA